MAGYRYRGSVSRYQVREQVAAPIPDASGYDLKPNPAKADTPAQFVEALRRLRIWAGEPSLRELERRCGGRPSYTTFSNMLHSSDLPSMDLAVVFVEALGLSADREEWLAAWRRLRFEDEP